MKHMKRTIAIVVLSVSGLLLLVMAIALNSIVDAVIASKLKEKLALVDGSIAYKMWLNPPVPVIFHVYAFDITNPDEVQQGLEQPAVVERGPYVFRVHIEKDNVVRHDENNTISYVQPQGYHFDREASVGSLNDTFTTVNIPFVTIALTMSKWPGFIQVILDGFMKFKGETAFKKLTVHDIFWGYEDPVLKEGYELLKKYGIHLPYLTEKFGFFYDKNNTGDGNYSVFSGVNGDLSNYCEIDLWNGKRHLNLWSTPKANEIKGTDGSLHPPYTTSDSKLKIFDAYLHRTLNLKFKRDSSYKGLDTLHFVVPFSEFDNATANPDNAGFCTPNSNYCVPSGCYNLSVASYGAPVYVSLPHFCGGDPYYQRQVLGLSPDPNKHQPYYDIYGLTGVSVKAARKYQINVRTQSFEYFSAYKNFPVSYLPIIWIDGAAIMGDSDIALFRDEIQRFLKAIPYVKDSMFALGGLLLALVCCLLGYWYFKGKSKDDEEREKLLSKEDENGSAYSSTNGNVQDI